MSRAEASGTGDVLSRGELTRRAKGGMFIVGSWGLVNLLVGFGGNLVLARMLVPRDFGLVAIGATLIQFAVTLSDGGLGSGLIRRKEAPARAELRAVLALQLGITLTLAVIVAAVASRFGEAGLVVAVMMAALPIAALQTPGKVVLSRKLQFQRLSLGDATGITTYYAWAILGVVAGYGVWAMATAAVVRALASSAAISRLSGVGVVLPTFHGVRALAPVVRFGMSFQAVSFTNVAREQAVNALTAMLAGVAALGLWTLARRLLEVPLLLFESLWRVSFPVMSQLLAGDEDPAPLIERSLALSTVAAGLLLSGIAGGAGELVPAVFGGQWRETGEILALGCAALLIIGPVSVSTIGYLYAAGKPSAVLRASLLQTLTLIAIAAPLLPVIGPIGLAAAWCLSATIEATLLARATRRECGARFLRPIVLPLVLAIAAGGAGAWTADATGPGLVAGIAGGAGATALFATALLVFRRRHLLEMVRMIAESVAAATSRHRPEPAPGPLAEPAVVAD